ncbi:Asp23/Gls24 family envelope stress response protein [Streptomyces sp. NPDC056161]|uniref:Asp23/Gls24 family envelope stress response protein n=1 Tax=Streptomyces sp. NPDC056161 TaxID=3345732 RepID=UPI0035DA25EA
MTSLSDGADGTRATAAVVVPGERGATRIADRVVAKIAAQAAREAVGVLPPQAAPPYATVVVRPPVPESARTRGTATASARVRVHLELDYPTDIGARCAAVRRHVAERVGALVSMEVPEVAVEIERLHPTPTHGADGRTR